MCRFGIALLTESSLWGFVGLLVGLAELLRILVFGDNIHCALTTIRITHLFPRRFGRNGRRRSRLEFRPNRRGPVAGGAGPMLLVTGRIVIALLAELSL